MIIFEKIGADYHTTMCFLFYICNFFENGIVITILWLITNALPWHFFLFFLENYGSKW